MLGLTYRSELDGWLDSRPASVGFLDVQLESFTTAFLPHLRWLVARYPLTVRWRSLSIGGFDELDAARLARALDVIAAAQPRSIVVALGFSRSGEVDLGVSVPLPRTAEILERVASRLALLRDRTGTPVAVENIASPIRIPDGLTEPAFINRLCETSGCGIRVDLTNLLLDSQRHGHDAAAWLRSLDATRVVDVRLTAPVARDLRVDAALIPVRLAMQAWPTPPLLLDIPEPTASRAIEHDLAIIGALRGDLRQPTAPTVE